MTEEEWLASSRSHDCLQFLRVKHAATRTSKGRRRLRLFACGTCRQFWQLLKDDRLCTVIEIAERHADGLATGFELESAYTTARALRHRDPINSTSGNQDRIASLMAIETASDRALKAAMYVSTMPFPLTEFGSSQLDPDELKCKLIRDVFGNPFRPTTFNPSWLTSTVLALARQMYDSRDFSAMPILADALQDAGCDNTTVLEHCRDPQGVHVRGCWVVDQLLGRE